MIYLWVRVDVSGLANLTARFTLIDGRPAGQQALIIPKSQPQFREARTAAGACLRGNVALFATDVRACRAARPRAPGPGGPDHTVPVAGASTGPNPTDGCPLTRLARRVYDIGVMTSVS